MYIGSSSCTHVCMYLLSCLLYLIYIMCVNANFVFILFVYMPIVYTNVRALHCLVVRSISSRGLFSTTSEDSIGAVNGLAVFFSELTLVLPSLVRTMMYIRSHVRTYCTYVQVHQNYVLYSTCIRMYILYIHTYKSS